jgi:hypothetical protein
MALKTTSGVGYDTRKESKQSNQLGTRIQNITAQTFWTPEEQTDRPTKFIQ